MTYIAIGLKIPDNTAYTALVALRRLGVAVDRVERSQIYAFDDDADLASLEARIQADETIFNPNTHRLTMLDGVHPRAGEVWIAPIVAAADRFAATAWRLFDGSGAPVGHGVLDAAIERLLCNPAIDRAVKGGDD